MSKKLKILSIFGTRPEAIKMAPVVLRLREMPELVDSRVCVTGQHREMLDQVLTLFGIVPDYDLDVMRERQDPVLVAASVLSGLHRIIEAERPDWVLVQGDTTTAMAGAIAGVYGRARVGHVEAGLRTHDKQQPFPEEINRRVVGVVADLHFAPTPWARENLLREGERPERVLVTGNPVIDALHMAAARPYTLAEGPLADIPADRRVILVTAHRRENWGAPMAEICEAVKTIAIEYPEDVHVVFPVHLNPAVKGPVSEALGQLPNVTLTPPLDYLPLVHLLRRAYIVLTDSGGLQEEAPGIGKPVLVLREVTERPEAVVAGTVRLVGTAYAHVLSSVKGLLDDPNAHASMARAVNPYGDGHAAKRIVDAILHFGHSSIDAIAPMT